MTVSISRLLGTAAALAVSLGVAQMQANAGPITKDSMVLNYSSDPNAQYGLCGPGGSGTLLKAFQLTTLNETLAKVLAITVLECRPSSGGAAQKVPCPAKSPYAYCINVGNDGQGNYVTLGIMKVNNSATARNNDPNASYSGTGSGCLVNTAKTKLDLLQEVKYGEPREVKAIVRLSCGPATVADRTAPVAVDCPQGPDPYRGYCLGTPNDGFGNAVTIGVVRMSGQGDPYGLYGNCNTSRPHIEDGFLRKSTLVEKLIPKRSLESVRTIDLIACSEFFNMPPGTPRDHLEVVSCSKFDTWQGGLALKPRYDYCIWGSDKKERGNGIFAGVNADNTAN